MPQHVIGGPNDAFKRIGRGECALYPCPGRLIIANSESRTVPMPEWINKRIEGEGRERINEIEVTTYAYRCAKCGHEVVSTELIGGVLTN